MKQLIAITLFALGAFVGKAQQINAAEYFIDTDPGAGNGVPITVTAGSTANFTASIPTTSLPNGFHVVAIRIKDNNGQWGLYESRGFYISASTANAADINAAEFFVDNDPGVGNGTPITPITSGSTVSFAASIPTIALAQGFHVVAIRTKDNNGQWGLYESRGFYISASTANAADINAAEFFVDTDPGVGNGTPITPITSGSTVNFTANVATTALAAGFHFLAIRTRDNNGQWGLYESRGFYISASTANVADISAAEFFVDADPGVGNGTPITPITSGSTVNFTANVTTTALAAGFHFLAIRTRDNNGQWGLYESRGFYISASTANVADISAAEFFVDTDPGPGNGTPITPITSGSTVNFTANVATTALAPGFHFLAIRTKNTEGEWGLYESRGFYISTATNNMPDMTAAEYFIDTDPGVGNATPISITPGQNFSQTLPLLVPLSTSQGSHFIAVRFKDADGHWGLYDFDTLTVLGTIPVTGLTLLAQKRQDKVALQWFTLTEYNSSHFELERSADGNRFEPISQVAAAGSSHTRRDYHYTDALPLPKLNYYRIRQVDRDGKAAYSSVQMVRMGSNKPFAVFPTVTSDKITITGINSPVKLRLYNATKQLVHVSTVSNSPATLGLQNLPVGSYWLLVEKDGQLLQHEMLIKQ